MANPSLPDQENDELTLASKIGIVVGEFVLTPLLGAVLYYVWRRQYPRRARFANLSAWSVFGVLIVLGVNRVLDNNDEAKSEEIDGVHTSERSTMEKVYDDIASFDTNDEGHVIAIGYAPIQFSFLFTDANAKELVEFKQLKRLTLPMVSELSDVGLQDLSRLPELEWLSISGAQEVSDVGLESLVSLEHLSQLGIGMTSVSDVGLESVGMLDNLVYLDLTVTSVGDEGISHLNGLRKLESLSLVATKITDEALKTLARLPALQILDIRGCNLTDAGLAHLANAPSLTRLTAFKTKSGGGLITDKGLNSLSTIKTLQFVDLSGNRISQSGVQSFREALPECVVEFGSDQSDDAVPR
jgi:hypothetical protein